MPFICAHTVTLAVIYEILFQEVWILRLSKINFNYGFSFDFRWTFPFNHTNPMSEINDCEQLFAQFWTTKLKLSSALVMFLSKSPKSSDNNWFCVIEDNCSPNKIANTTWILAYFDTKLKVIESRFEVTENSAILVRHGMNKRLELSCWISYTLLCGNSLK